MQHDELVVRDPHAMTAAVDEGLDPHHQGWGHDPYYDGPAPGCCELCGADEPLAHVSLGQNVGLLIMRFGSRTEGLLCARCLDSEFWTKTMVTAFFGWWGVISFFVTLFTLPSNLVSYLGAKKALAAQASVTPQLR